MQIDQKQRSKRKAEEWQAKSKWKESRKQARVSEMHKTSKRNATEKQGKGKGNHFKTEGNTSDK